METFEKISDEAFERMSELEQLNYVKELFKGREPFPRLVEEARQLVSEIKVFSWDEPKS